MVPYRDFTFSRLVVHLFIMHSLLSSNIDTTGLLFASTNILLNVSFMLFTSVSHTIDFVNLDLDQNLFRSQINVTH